MDVDINLLAVLLAGVSSMAVGSIWYAQSVFGNTWAKLAKVNMNKKVENNEMVKLLSLTFLASLVTAYVLAHVTYLSHSFFTENSYLMNALNTSFWVWLGFTAMRFWTHDMFEGRRKKLTALNAGNELVTLMLMGLVIGLVGL